MGEEAVQREWQTATELHRAGRWAEAEGAYRRVIGAAQANLGVVLAVQGRRGEAVESLRRSLEQGHYPEIYNTLGSLFQQQGDLDQAVDSFGKAVALRPDYVDAHFNLATALTAAGRGPDAIDSYRRVVRLQPGHVAALNNLGQLLCQSGRTDEGVETFARAVALRGDFFEARSNLGTALTSLGRYGEALVHLTAAAGLRPDSPDVLNNLGNALRMAGNHDEAIRAMRRAVTLRPGFVEALGNLAAVLKDAGLIEQSIECYRRAIALRDDAPIAAGLLFALHHDPKTTAAQLKSEHVEWDRKYASAHAASWTRHANDPMPDRKLRVGYLGAVGDSPVGRFMLRLLANHDREKLEPIVYADVPHGDRFAPKLQEHVSLWRNIFTWTDEQVVSAVREDRVDILVDLAMHGGRNRLMAFARKPAPVQATYLAYAGTTGMAAIDYRISDPYLDPPGRGDEDYSEKTVRLPRTFWCYDPGAEVPEPTEAPCERNGFITFGCLNSSAKVNGEVLKAWRLVLDAVPGSKMLLHWHDGENRRRVAETLGAGRVEFVGLVPIDRYFETYLRIDIALDPFPFCGGTTTCDALWMGTPVVTMAGATSVSRGGKSILNNVGFAQWVAHDLETYVQRAVGLAACTDSLALLRRRLRARMQDSPLMDGTRFAHDFETALRAMWREHCQSAKP